MLPFISVEWFENDALKFEVKWSCLCWCGLFTPSDSVFGLSYWGWLMQCRFHVYPYLNLLSCFNRSWSKHVVSFWGNMNICFTHLRKIPSVYHRLCKSLLWLMCWRKWNTQGKWLIAVWTLIRWQTTIRSFFLAHL